MTGALVVLWWCDVLGIKVAQMNTGCCGTKRALDLRF